MNEAPGKPKISIEIDSATPGVLIVGEKSPLLLPLREIFYSCGIKINDPQDFNYIFQLGNFEKIEFFLEKATTSGARFFLILGGQETKLSKKAEELTEKFIQTKKLDAKIIKLSGFAGSEVEAVKKILKIAFSQTPQTRISLTGPETFWEKSQGRQNVLARKRLVLWGASIVLLLFLLTAPITFILANIFLGTLSLKNAREAAFSSKFEKGERQAEVSQKHFALAKSGFGTLAPLFRLLGKEDQAREIENWLEIGQDLGGATKHLIEVGQEGQKLARLILNQEQGKIDELLAKVAADIGLAEEELALIEAKTANKKPLIFEESLSQIRNLRKGLLSLKNFLGVAPWVLGLKEKRTYLVLFQNNFELRPGGGFIGTIGLLTFTNGKLDLKIEDVYTADGQLRGHVEPPQPIKTHLGQIHWYLRDSNWEPDFPTNARRASWFLEKELGIKPDGVIAIDLIFVKKILALTGSVDLADYQEKISSENLFLKAQIYSQESFFPGSTQKRDFLSSLARALFDKMVTDSNFSWLGMAKAVEEAAEKKHLQVYLENSLAQKLVNEQGWGGEVKNIKNKNENIKIIDDYLMMVEANLGVNKANYFVKREIKKEIEAKDNFLFSKIILNYENTSPANVSFGGIYKNYLRVLVPANSTLEEVKIDGQILALDKIDQETTFAKSSTGFLVEVPPGGKKTVVVSYKLSFDPSWKDFTYQLLVQKQPGTEKDPLTLAVLTPSWQILETNFPTLVKIGNLSYNTDLSVDRVFEIKFKK